MKKDDYLMIATEVHKIEETLSSLLKNEVTAEEAVSLVMSNLTFITSRAFRVLSETHSFKELQEIKKEEYSLKGK